MSRTICMTMVAGALCLLLAGTVSATVPSQINSAIPDWVPVAGNLNGTADDNSDLITTVIIRDFTNNPIPDVWVDLDFTACHSELALCKIAIINAGTVTCVGATGSGRVRAKTDIVGKIVLTVVGGAKNTSGSAGQGLPACGIVLVDVDGNGIPETNWGSFKSFVVNQNGFNADIGVGPNPGNVDGTDLALGQGDVLLIGTNGYRQRTDYDRSGTLTGTDLSKHQGFFLLGKSRHGCWTLAGGLDYCP